MRHQSFTGFPQETIQFFTKLSQNNNRQWFHTHRKEYNKYVVAPTKAFVRTMGKRLRSVSPHIQYDARTNGCGSMMRLHRDIRFSKDKSPYKTFLGILFWEGYSKKIECPNFFFGLNSHGAGLHVGLHSFSKPFLTAYRNAVIDDTLGPQLIDTLRTISATGTYTFSGDYYRRIPRGYDKCHPRAQFLLFDGLYASAPAIDMCVLNSPDLIDICYEHFRQMAPLHHWLVQVSQTIGMNRMLRQQMHYNVGTVGVGL